MGKELQSYLGTVCAREGISMEKIEEAFEKAKASLNEEEYSLITKVIDEALYLAWRTGTGA